MPQIGGGLTDQPIRLVRAGGGPALIVNRDLTNNILIGENNGIIGGNPNEVSIVDPLGSVAVDGKSDIYGLRAPGSTANPVADVMYGATSWAPSPAQVALQIAALGLAKDTTVAGVTTAVGGTTTAVNTGNGRLSTLNATLGTPAQDASVDGIATNQLNGNQLTGFVNSPTPLYSTNGTKTLTASQSMTMTPVNPSPNMGYAPVNELGYEITIGGGPCNSSTGSPFLRVDFYFYDADSGTSPVVDHFRYYVPAGLTSTLTYGRGLLRGAYMSCIVTNTDSAFSMSLSSFIINGVGRTYSRDDWRSDVLATMPGFTNAGGQPSALVLAEMNNVGSPASRIMPLYSGKIRLLFNPSASGLTLKVAPINSGAISPYNFTSSSSANNLAEVNLGRDCYQLVASGTGTVNVSVIIEEY